MFTTDLSRSAQTWLAKARVPGAAIALVHRGRVVWVRGFGISDRDRARRVSKASVFQVASVSKSVTAWGVMRIIEAGKAKLDDPIEKYLTRWHLPASEHDGQAVTIRRLLSQRQACP